MLGIAWLAASQEAPWELVNGIADSMNDNWVNMAASTLK